ncbi:MAG: glutamate--tRNA ligase family protein, partial [Oscillospiraceae bacterium]|nr:glutamate--tRNA ligase family protein [Oscillospiraceae bacterium]
MNLSNLLFPNVTRTPDDVRAAYPPRDLPQGAVVARHAPSPTGFVHLGNLYQSLICERLAHQSGGVVFLRIEDTDQKRKVEGATEAIISGLAYYGVNFDEGETFGGQYAPYTQSQRAEIYHVYAKWLVEQGFAYPCFCCEDTLEATRTQQMEQKEPNIGYHGKWAYCRDMPISEVQEKLASNAPWILRFRVPEENATSFKHTDLVKGEINITPNPIDHVLLKSDGIPTYHLARSIDDQLMGVTHVIRGDEWLATFPFHLQLDRALGFRTQKFMHFGPLQKMDGTSKRKLSKRHDPELALAFYRESGYPAHSVREYMLTILNSNFEDWRRANPATDLTEFPFSAKKITPSGCLFDLAKLQDVSKNIVATMTAEEVYGEYIDWAAEFEPKIHALMTADPNYARRIFAIGRGGAKPRKDIATW